jgi:putative ABC transport system permease protein
VEVSLPFFNEIAGKKIVFLLGDGLGANPYFYLVALAFALFVAIVAGIYPALYLSSFKPVKVLKSASAGIGKLTSLPRRALVVLQFAVSVSLIISAVAVFRQVKFGQSRSAGYDKSRLVNVQMVPSRISLEALTHDLVQSGAVVSVAQSSGPATEVLSNASGFEWAGKATGFQESFAVIAASHSYGKTVGWQVKEGRDFSKEFSSDSAGIILNESAVKYMGLTDPVGKTVRWKDGTFNDNSYHVVGVIKDMVMQSPFEPVKQTIYFMTYAPNFLYIRIAPGAEISQALAKIQAVFHQHLPDTLFDFKFADKQYGLKFASEERTGKLVFLFASLAIFISCLGLFGLAAFSAEQRTKEIGVRKVLGASVLSIWMLVSKEFIYLVVAGLAVATPVTAYLLREWLSQYPYHADLAWWIFALSGLSALVLTMLTVSVQAVQAALTDPVKSLRTE